MYKWKILNRYRSSKKVKIKSIKFLWENLEEKNGLKINFLKIKKNNLKKIIAYSEFCLEFEPKKISRPILKKNFSEIGISNFENQILKNLGIEEIMEIVDFSRIFGVVGLEELGCAKIVCELKGLSENDLKKVLRVN